MITTLEDIVELLASKTATVHHVRLDRSDSKILTSIANQTVSGMGLTDRQATMILQKIQKYTQVLTELGVDVELVTATRPLRLPIRQVDRTMAVYFSQAEGLTKPRIMIKYVFSKEFAETWAILEDQLTGVTTKEKNIKEIEYSEQNLLQVVQHLAPLSFNISSEVQMVYKKMLEILKNPQKFAPYIDIVNHTVTLINAPVRCADFLNSKFQAGADNNILEFVSEAKTCGIFLKSPNFIKKLSEAVTCDLTKNILFEPSTRFRLANTKQNIKTLFTAINNINQWPVLVVIDENKDTCNQIKELHGLLSTFLSADEISVFFRMKDRQNKADEFNQYIKDNHLNNYIGANTKCVFISKSRIPKPLLRSDWTPKTAVCFITHDYGKLGVYLNDFASVYYINDSLTTRHNRLLRNTKIVQL